MVNLCLLLEEGYEVSGDSRAYLDAAGWVQKTHGSITIRCGLHRMVSHHDLLYNVQQMK